MKPNDPTGKPVEEGKTGEFLDQTIESAVRSGKGDPDATIAGGDSEPAGPRRAGKFSESAGDWIGPYRLVEEIGSGGMGTVYMAEQIEPVKRQVALKIIKAGMDTSQVIARFEAERQALSMMEHANIARVLDASATEQGRPYFVMELVRGLPVTRFCDKHQLGIEERLKLFVKICNAIQHAHQKGIIHRDLKPSNVLVAMQDDQPIPKVIDFGVAKATNQRLTEKTMYTQQGQVVGTLEYMSPEQAQMTDANVDTRSDIYSLGVVLYELLTGNTPLNRKSLTNLGYLEILNRIKDEEPARPSSRLTETVDKLDAIAAARGVEPRKLFGLLRGDLDWIVLKALEKEPARRYESASGLADDVERFLHAEPIAARPPTGWYLVRKFARRHKVAVAAGTAMLLTLVAGITLTTTQWYRAKKAESTVAEQLVALQDNYRLETENARLQRDIQRENEALQATLSADIRSLASHGQWNATLEKLRNFESQFGEMPLNLAMLRLDALDGLSRTKQLKAEIVRLERHPDAQRFESRLKLWRGYAFLAASDDLADARALIQEAIAGGDHDQLRDSDRLFAEGLVAESLLQAIEKYRQALELAPFNSQARMQLVVTLVLLGRYDGAQQEIRLGKMLFPNDTRFYFSEPVSHALANQHGRLANSTRDLRERFPRSNIKNLRALGRLSRAVNQQFRDYDREGLMDWFRIMREGLPLFQESSYQAIPVPEFQKVRVFNAYGEFANSFVNPLMVIATDRKKHRLIIDNCQSAWDIHHDGMFKCFEAWSWLALEDYENSAKAFGIAMESDGLFPEIRNQSVYGAFISRKLQYDKTEDASLLDEAMQFLDRYVQQDFETHRASTMFRASCEADRWDLARTITEKMIERESNRFNWQMNLMTEARNRNNLGLALSVCDDMLRDSPDSTTLQNKRAEIVKQITSGLN